MEEWLDELGGCLSVVGGWLDEWLLDEWLVDSWIEEW